jgi:hypothetical protein
MTGRFRYPAVSPWSIPCQDNFARSSTQFDDVIPAVPRIPASRFRLTQSHYSQTLLPTRRCSEAASPLLDTGSAPGTVAGSQALRITEFSSRPPTSRRLSGVDVESRLCLQRNS